MSILLALAAPAWSQASSTVRKTTLTDNRTFVSEVLGTEATGLRVRVPAGEMLLSFEELADLRPADATAYAAQPAWGVLLVAPESVREGAKNLLNAMTGVRASTVNEPDPAIPAGTLEGCADLSCISARTKDLPWYWALNVEPHDDGTWTVTSVVTLASQPLPRVVHTTDTGPDGLWKGLHEAIRLDPPRGGAPSVPGFDAGSTAKPPKGPKGGADVTADRVASWSYVPVPGYSAMRQGDGQGAAFSILGTLATAAVVGVGGGLAGSDAQGDFSPAWAAVGGGTGLVVGAMFTNNWFGTHAFESRSPAAAEARVGRSLAPAAK